MYFCEHSLFLKRPVPPWSPCSSWMHCDTLTESNHILGDILCQDEGDFCRVGSPGISGRTWWVFCKDVLKSAASRSDAVLAPKHSLRKWTQLCARPSYNIHQHRVSKYISFLEERGKASFLHVLYRDKNVNHQDVCNVYVTCFQFTDMMTSGHKLAFLSEFWASRHVR